MAVQILNNSQSCWAILRNNWFVFLGLIFIQSTLIPLLSVGLGAHARYLKTHLKTHNGEK